MKILYTRIPLALYQRVVKEARKRDLKLVAVVRQALMLWLEQK